MDSLTTTAAAQRDGPVRFVHALARWEPFSVVMTSSALRFGRVAAAYSGSP
jgi:hypothetical protein